MVRLPTTLHLGAAVVVVALLLFWPQHTRAQPSLPNRPPPPRSALEKPDADEALREDMSGESGPRLRERMRDELAQMREFFDNVLPGTLRKYNLEFSFSPKLGDMRRREYIRYPFTFRYGLGERWELYAGMTPFSPNPFNSGHDHRWGPGEGKLGARYDWGHWGDLFEHVTLGLEVRSPLGSPPLRIIDRYSHLAPSINTSRGLPWRFTTLYSSVRYDRMFETPGREPPPSRFTRQHVFSVTNGVLYKPKEFGGSFEYTFRHIQDEGSNTRLGHEFKTGPIWDIPRWRSHKWGLPGKFQLEVAFRVTLEEGRDLDHGVTLRARWRTTVREVLSHYDKDKK